MTIGSVRARCRAGARSARHRGPLPPTFRPDRCSPSCRASSGSPRSRPPLEHALPLPGEKEAMVRSVSATQPSLERFAGDARPREGPPVAKDGHVERRVALGSENPHSPPRPHRPDLLALGVGLAEHRARGCVRTGCVSYLANDVLGRRLEEGGLRCRCGADERQEDDGDQHQVSSRSHAPRTCQWTTRACLTQRVSIS
jgi:hypothetical protein